MTTFTKEQLIEHIGKRMDDRRGLLNKATLAPGFREYLEKEVATDEIALASLAAEPVPFDALRDAVAEMSGGPAMEWSDIYKGHQAVTFINFNSLSRIVEKFRTTQPAVVMPDEIDVNDPALDTHRKWMAEGWNRCRAAMQGKAESQDKLAFDNQVLSDLYHAQEKRLFKIAQRIKGPAFDKYAYSPSQAIDVLEAAIFGERKDAHTAAMLQANAKNDESPICD
ncbi:hypothetical protein [Lelliottia nimipressuralis]|uniref:hypothetical protein n=1 Tax=Lelliottia nimipressuralis TaxID=69220 RepID=UPI0016544ED2|nr:hypothetical protein [Lelliottia nimipressuralis]